MNRRIMINTKSVYDISKRYEASYEELLAIVDEINSIEEGIKESWQNPVSENFLSKLEGQKNNCLIVARSLKSKSNHLKKMSINHYDSDSELKTLVERSRIDE